MTRSTLPSLVLLGSTALWGCAAEAITDEPDTHAEAPDDATFDDLDTTSASLALSALGRGCTTAGTEGLSAQLLDEMLCLSEGAVVEVSHPNIVATSSRVHLILSPEGRDALLRTAATRRIEINSAFRTIAEQYVLSRGCSVAASPGRSNHETGRAIDVNNYRSVGGALVANGFSHPLPSSDPVHYEAPGADLRSVSVLAFQRLWNANNPTDRLQEDGVPGGQTLARLARSPAGGFATGRTCEASPEDPAPPPAPAPTPAPPPPPPPTPPPPPPPPSTRPAFSEVIGTGVTYHWRARARTDRVLIVYGGYGASDAASTGWATALDGAWLAPRDGAHLFSVRGPAAVDYRGLEIGNSRIVRRLGELTTASAGAPLEITIVAHSSGAFVANELFAQLVAARASGSVVASITYYNLDGARMNVGLDVLEAYCPVYATSGSLRSPNADSAIADGRSSTTSGKGHVIVVDASASGCTGAWCVHDALITSRPHNPSGLDVARDYTDWVGRSVVIDYLTAGCSGGS